MDRVILLDKPEGPTSHDMVDALRAVLGTRRVGHTGTLDPLASGLLVLLSGRATRLAELFRGHDKLYRGSVRFGTSTDTDDREGKVLERCGDFALDESAVAGAMAEIAGRSEQRTPRYSAVKVGGVPLYKQARKGAPIEAPMRPVLIHRLSLLGLEKKEAHFELSCSAGTYVRALARDLGELLGIPAHLSALRRLCSGPYSVEDALDLAELQESGRDARMLELDEALGHLPVAIVRPEYLSALRHGRQPGEADLVPPDPLPPPGAWVALRSEDGHLMAMARVEDGPEGPRLRVRRTLEEGS